MDSEDENFITYGTPVITDENEEEVPRKKPIPIEQQIVTDERGLRRFHGAFTGGFSAGYFNSVGSKEGWTPATFVSSRSSRTNKNEQRPEDFMDTEDLGAFGIAPRGFRVNKKFAEETTTENKLKRPYLGLDKGPIPGIAPLRDLIVPVRESVGINLLRKMGWKSGQGIGPRVHLKQKLKRSQTKGVQTGVKLYGCRLPDETLNEDEDELPGITFAPDDVKIDLFKTKEDWHGLGYVGLNKNPILNTFRDGNRRALPFVDKSKKLAIAGEAFGVGAYEDDDESIYTIEDMSQYDFEMGGDSNLDKHKSEKSKPSHSLGYIRKELEGFHLTSKSLPPKKFYPPPVLPKTFQPFHKTCGQDIPTTAERPSRGLDRHKMTALDRTAVISNEPPSSTTGSVFDHLRPEDRARLQEIRKATASGSPLPTPTTVPQVGESSSRPRPSWTSGSGFKPFAQDDDKQKRYELYLKLRESKNEDVFSKCQPTTMTEWEKQREQEEFRRSAVIYKPLSYSMASRFVSAKHTDTTDQTPNDIVTTHTKLNENQQKAEKAVREKLEWHPDRLLCRRFNIPNPYPDSTLVGIPKVRRDKYSIFNFLSVPEAPMSVEDIHEESTAQGETNASSISPPTVFEPEFKNEPPKHKDTTNLFSCLEEKASNFESLSSKQDLSVPTKPLDSKQVVEDAEQTRPPMDLFKAIFRDTDSETDSSSDEVSEEQQNTKETTITAISLMDAIQKPKPPSPDKTASNSITLMGVFSNIDFDALNRKLEKSAPLPTSEVKKLSSIAVKVTNSANVSGSSDAVCESDGYYGPSLPPNLIQANSSESTSHSVNLGSVSRHVLGGDFKYDIWDIQKDKNKHKHKHKKKHKHSKQRHHQKVSSDEATSELESNINLDQTILHRVKQLKRSTKH